MKKSHGRFIIIFAVIAVIAIVIAYIFIKNNTNAASSRTSNAPIPVETVNAVIRPMQEIREFNGTVKPAYSYVVSAKVSGRLMDINKRIGDKVNSNETIGHIDDTEYRNALDEANTQLSHTETELNRARELFERGIVSKAEFDALNTQYQTQKSKRDLALTTFNYTNIKTAKSGFIAERHIDGGALLSVGTPIVTVVGIDTVFIELSVSERDYINISAGKKAIVRAEAIPNETFEGTVHRVAPFFRTGSRTALVEVALKNDKQLLKPGMSARVSITLEENDSAQAIPVGALIEKDGKEAIFVINDSLKAELISVETGIAEGKSVQILSPNNIDKPVVTLGHHLLREGSSVRIYSTKESE